MDINDSNNKSSQTGGLKLMTVFIAVLALHVVVIGGFTVYHLMSGGSSDTDMTTGDKMHKSGTSVADGTLPDPTQGDKSTPPTEVATIPATTVTPVPTTTTPTPDATTTPAPATPDVATTSTAVTPAPAATTSTTTPATTPTETASTTSASTTTPAPEPTSTTATTVPGAALTSATSTSTEASAPAPAPVTEIANPGPQTPSGPIPAGLAPPPDASTASAPAPAPVPALIPVPQSAPASSLASGPVHMPPANVSPEAPRTEHAHMKVYIVKITDSYKKIAHKYHVSVAQLKEANHITNNVLHTGQKLYIPSDRSEVADKAPTSPLDAAPILSESASPMTTGLNSTSTTITSTGLHHHIYTVVKGDTLTRIAHHYKTTVSALMAENGITDPTKLSIGKKLRIPSSSEETRSARATPVTPQPSQVQAKTSTTTAQLANYGN